MDKTELVTRGMSKEESARFAAKVEAERAKRSGSRSFRAFVKQAWQYIDPAPLVWNWSLEVFCDHLEAVARGDIKRLITNVPPRHSKSNIFAICFPAWVWIDNPTEQFLFLSYAAELSVEHSVKCRQLMESDWYREQFQIKWRLADDQNVKHDFVNTAGGRRRATSITGKITGMGGGIICIDDPLNAEDSNSKTARDEANRVLADVIATRLNDPKTGRIALVMQRLHQDDPTGKLISDGGWEHLMLPSEFEPDRRSITHVVVDGERKEFWRDPRTEAGELLFPARFDRAVLDGIRTTLKETKYAAQHQQRPAPAGGIMFKNEWWRFWKKDGVGEAVAPRPDGCYLGPAHPLPSAFEAVIITVDANFKKHSDADPVSIQAWGVRGPDRFRLAIVNAPLGFIGAVKAIAGMMAVLEQIYVIRAIIIETAANGDAIIETLQEKFSCVIGVKAEGGKEARAWASQPMVQGGNCYLEDGAPDLQDWMDEFSTFPKGKHDDRVDAWGHAMMHLAHGPKTTMDLWMDVLP